MEPESHEREISMRKRRKKYHRGAKYAEKQEMTQVNVSRADEGVGGDADGARNVPSEVIAEPFPQSATFETLHFLNVSELLICPAGAKRRRPSYRRAESHTLPGEFRRDDRTRHLVTFTSAPTTTSERRLTEFSPSPQMENDTRQAIATSGGA